MTNEKQSKKEISKENLTVQSKEDLIKSKGWLPYEGETWIHENWLKNQPYDRMAIDLNSAYDYEIKKSKRGWRYVDEI